MGSKRTQGHLQPHFRTRVIATLLLTPTYEIIAYTPLTNCRFKSEFKSFNPIQDGLFWGCSWMGGSLFAPPLPKICHTYPTMIKLGTVIPCLRKTQKIWITWHIPWVLPASAFFLEKSADFATSRNAGIDWILIHNLQFF